MNKVKIRDGYILRRVGNENIVVAVGKATSELNGIVRLNDTCAEIWRALCEEKTPDEIADILTEKYSVSREKALDDTLATIEKLRQNRLAE